MLSQSSHMAGQLGLSQSAEEEDLLMLREDLAEEWGAVVGYLECSGEIKDRLISEEFRKAAQDEVEHIIRLTRMLAVLDQTQADALRKAGLFWLAGFEHQTAVDPLTAEGHSQGETENSFRSPKSGPRRYFEPDDRSLECLRNAIRDELKAINAYQRQIRAAVNQMVRTTLIIIMNRKKKHVAVFTDCLQNLLREYRLPLG
jgi:rubrerythrin